MYLLNLGHKWNLASDVDKINGAIFISSGNTEKRLLNSRLPELQKLLLDPQLYLCSLDVTECQKHCAKLASFPWYGFKKIPKLDDSNNSREWEKKLGEYVAKEWQGEIPKDISKSSYSAIEFQQRIGCTHIILPSPLITDREDEAGILMDWIDAGIEAKDELEVSQPLLATIALDESVVNEAAFKSDGYFSTLIDQVTSRDELDGVYLVIMQSHPRHPFFTNKLIYQAYMYITKELSKSGLDHLIINFADVFGLFCIAAGATGIGSGASFPLRKLSKQLFKESGGGLALPHFYSHRIMGEFLSEYDLDIIVEKQLMRKILDETAYSVDLIRELKSGGSAQNLPSWAESKNNISFAQKHFVSRINFEANTLTKLSNSEKKDRLRDQIENAIANKLYFESKLRMDDLKGKVAPSASWLNIFDKYIK